MLTWCFAVPLLLVLMGVMLLLLLQQQQNCDISFNRGPNYY
jgi:hypothetical protein